MPVTQAQPPRLIGEARTERRGLASSGEQPPAGQDDDEQLRAAMAMSLEGQAVESAKAEEEELKLAMQLSRSLMEQEEEMVQAAMSATSADQAKVASEEDQLQEAIAMSLRNQSQDDDLRKALEMSSKSSKCLSVLKMKLKRLPFPRFAIQSGTTAVEGTQRTNNNRKDFSPKSVAFKGTNVASQGTNVASQGTQASSDHCWSLNDARRGTKAQWRKDEGLTSSPETVYSRSRGSPPEETRFPKQK